jgi:hypothetical protein
MITPSYSFLYNTSGLCGFKDYDPTNDFMGE